MLDPLDGDDACLLVALPQGSPGGLQLLAVEDRLGDVPRGLGLLALAGHSGLDRAAQPQGILGGGRKHGGSAAAHRGDRDASLASIDRRAQHRRVQPQVLGDALHGCEALGVHGLRPYGHLGGEALHHPGVEALGDLLEVGLDRGRLPAGAGLLEPERQQDEPRGIVLDPLGGGRVQGQELKGLEDRLSSLIVLQQRVHRAIGSQKQHR